MEKKKADGEEALTPKTILKDINDRAKGVQK